MLTVLQILDNAALLTLAGLGFYFVERIRDRLGPMLRRMLHGVNFAISAFLVTASPVTLVDGALIDARAGPVILAGVVAGPIGGLMAGASGGLSRYLMGGEFAFSGMAVFFLYAAIGIAAARFRIVSDRRAFSMPSIIALTLASFCAASAMFFLIDPRERALFWLQQDLPFILLANALSLVFLASILRAAIYFVRKNTELIVLNERLNLAKRAGGFGIWDFDIRTGVLNWDKRSAELHGVDPESVEGTYEDWARNVHPDDLSGTEQIFRDALSTGNPFDSEYRVRLPQGTERTIKGDAIVLRDSKGQPERVVGTNLDLTKLRTTEAKLDKATSIVMHSQKFDTIGQLTGGVAHDFNNLLAVVTGNQELLRDQLQSDKFDLDEMRALIDASLEATKRGAELTQNMLAYARQAQLTPELTDLNQVVRETGNWLRRTIESRIEIRTVLQKDLWQTRVDRVSLQTALVNLLVNARDAFEGSGKVTIETGNVRIASDDSEEPQNEMRPGRYVMLTVSDNGSGIAPDILDCIFDPFFTTKRVGKGSGLGLSMVQGFVKQSGGTIRVHSEPGAGTTFKIYFPAAPEAACARDADIKEEGPSALRQQSGKRLLVVEDQLDLLSVMEKMLSVAGYDVVTAASGDEAYRIFESTPGVDLVVSDIVMPGELQGPGLAKKIRAVRPGMRFIFISGYASDSAVRGNCLLPGDIRLMKPVSRKELLDAVQKAFSDQ